MGLKYRVIAVQRDILLRSVSFVITVLLAGILALQTPRVQTHLIQKVKSIIEENIDGKVTIGSIYVTPVSTVVIKDLTVIDDNPYVSGPDDFQFTPIDTLAHIKSLSASFSLRGLLSKRGVHVNRVHINGGSFAYVGENGEEYKSNILRLINFKKKEKTAKDKILFHIGKLDIQDFRVRVILAAGKFNFRGYGVNWNDEDYHVHQIKGHNFYARTKGDGTILGGVLDHAEISEKTGLHAMHISGRTRSGAGKDIVEKFRFRDEFSDIYIPELTFSFDDKHAFSHFNEKVRIDAEIGRSTVSYQTLRYFTPNNQMNNTFCADVRGAKVSGYINDLHVKDLELLDTDSDTWVSGRVDMIGLPHVRNTVFDINASSIQFSTEGISKICNNFTRGLGRKEVNLGKYAKGQTFNFKGTAKGPLDKFIVKGTVKTDGGVMTADLDLRNILDKQRPIEASGVIETDDVNVGRIAGIRQLGPVTLKTGLRATLGHSPSVIVDSLFVDRLNAMKYDYSGIAAVGKFSGESFDGKIICNDPNLNFIFQGIFNLSKKTNNALYKFYANLGYADLKALNLDNRGTTSKASGQVSANFMYVNKGDIIGDIDVDGLMLENDYGHHDIGEVHIASHSNADIHRIQLNSDFANAGFIGSRSITHLLADIQKITTRRNLPLLYSSKDKATPWDGGDYDLDCQFHDSRGLLSFLAPGAYIADSTALSLRIDRNGSLNGSITSPRLAFNDKYLKGLDVTVDNLDRSINCTLTSDEIKLSALEMVNTALTGYGADNEFSLSYHYDSKASSANSGEIYISGEIARDLTDTLIVKARPLSSYLTVDNDNWEFGDSEIRYRAGDISVDNFRISSGDQSVIVDGILSRRSEGKLRVDLRNIALSILDSITERELGIDGRLTGFAQLHSPLNENKGIWSNLICENLSIGGAPSGDLRFASTWDKDNSLMNFLLRNIDGDTDALRINGSYSPETKVIDTDASFKGFNLSSLNPLVESLISQIGGKLNGDVSIHGRTSAPSISSQGLELDNAELRVALTDVPYILNGPFHVDSTGVHIDNIYIRDRYNGTGRLTGQLNFRDFKEMDLEAALHLNSMEVMNNTMAQSKSIYGNIFASGDVTVNGPIKGLFIDATATTVGDGRLHIPISRGGSSGTKQLLTFTERAKYEDPYEIMRRQMTEVDRTAKRSGMTVKARINATPDVLAMLDLDKESGNSFSARGSGLITIDMAPSRGVFNLGGKYNVNDGDFKFTALGLVSKLFTIQEGSSISFNGDVMSTEFDVNAMYSLKTTLSTLIADTTSVSARRTVNCGIKITDNLKNPKLDFSIDVPDLDPSTKSLVENSLNSSDKIQKQFIALLLTGGFIPNEQSGVVYNTSNVLYNNLSDIMSGQLNNILKRLDIPLDLGLNYQQNAGGRDIFDVAVSTQLFNNRVIVNGSVANRQMKSGGNTNDVVGDLDVDIKLDKSGQLRFNLFSHSADAYTSYLDNTQRNGVGITYQREYNKLGEFLRSLFMTKEQREQRKLERVLKQQDKTTIRIEDEDKR